MTHYLNDYIVLGSADTSQCERDLKILVNVCECLGVPLAEEKMEGPATRLEILGIIVDSETMQLSLPENKLEELRTLLREYQGRKLQQKGRCNHSQGSYSTRRRWYDQGDVLCGTSMTSLL